MPVHRLRGTDPNWRFREISDAERDRGASSTFFLLAGHGPARRCLARGVRPPAAAPRGDDPRERRRGRAARDLAARDAGLLAAEVRALELGRRSAASATTTCGSTRTRTSRRCLRSACATTPRSGSPTPPASGRASRTRSAPGTSPGARSTSSRSRSRRWTSRSARSGTSASPRARRRPPARAPRLRRRARGGFSVLWHTDRFDPGTARGWDRLYLRLLDAVRERGAFLGGRARERGRSRRSSCENPPVSGRAPRSPARAPTARSGGRCAGRHPRELAFQRRVRRGFEGSFLRDRTRWPTRRRSGRALLEHIREKRRVRRDRRRPGATATRRAGSASPSARTCTRSCGR